MEIFRTLGALIEPPAAEHKELAAILELGEPPSSSVYSEIFLFQLYPYASVYLGPEGKLGGEARDRIAGFWRALEETPPPECDHLAPLLALYARLCDLESTASEKRAAAYWNHARRAFFWEHLASWLPVFLDKMERVADTYYGRWAQVARRALEAEAKTLLQPEILSAHLRDAAGLEEPHEGKGDSFLDSLLAPVRSGIILVRSDLEAAASELSLGARFGERKFALRALLGQDPGATLAWIGRQAQLWAERHARLVETYGATASFWESRARRAGRLMARLSAEA